ncbi:MAG: hypothetical protein HYY17_02115 [Planctomycetes bacterium]|nr:hypothetical protein [Planctomycetota bacterium]
MSRGSAFTLIAALVVAALAVGGWLARRQKEASRAAQAKTASPPVDELPDRPEFRAAPVSKKDASPADVPKRTNPADEELARRRGEHSRQWFEWWMKNRETETKAGLDVLASSAALPPERVSSIRSLLDVEEKAWRTDFEKRMAPAFEGQGHPKFAFIESAEYRAFIDGITGETDRQARTLLDGAQWKPYEEWRAKYVRRMYFHVEEKR